MNAYEFLLIVEAISEEKLRVSTLLYRFFVLINYRNMQMDLGSVSYVVPCHTVLIKFSLNFAGLAKYD